MNQQGQQMHQWARDLWPINRSLTGQGVRDTFAYLRKILPELNCQSIASGSHVFDWTVPQEWHCRAAYIITPSGEKIADFSQCNLHLVGYSTPVNNTMSLAELKPHLHSLPEQPELIPYVTSYYAKNWGFCISHQQWLMLEEGDYRVVIDSDLFDGVLDYADLLIKGKSKQEILLSTNVCHPSLANNELSGPVMVAQLGQWLLQHQQDLHYSYRLAFVPETIGALVYLSRFKDHLIEHVVGGYQVICVGDERAFSYNASPYGDNWSDAIAQQVLANTANFDSYSFLQRGSDERQYCAPHIRLPIASICRSKYAIYPEYHTSGDNLIDVVTPKGLQQSFDVYRQCIEQFEQQKKPQQAPMRTINPAYPSINCFGEPQLGKRGLYYTVNQADHLLAGIDSRTIINIITYCDGSNSVEDIADIIGVDTQVCHQVIMVLKQCSLL